MRKIILIIEDDEQVRDNIEDILLLEDFEVVTAENGAVGLRLVKETRPDLILCDVMMPELDGFGVLAQLQQDEDIATIPLIFLTAKADRLDIRQGMELGADDYITKPFTHKDLLKAITTRLEKRATIVKKNQQQLSELRFSITHSLPHELRTPLNGIMGFTELLLYEDELEREEIQEMAQSIKASAARLYRLIQNFLLYANLEIIAAAPEQLAQLRQASTNSVLELLSEPAYQLTQDHHREADLQLELQDAAIQMSADHLQKVMQELLDNAIKFSQPGTPIRVASYLDTQYTLSISDHGKGMRPEQIAQVGAYMQFERKIYEQQGSGLGLAIAQRLVELYKGQLTINSTPDQGTTVAVTLPLKKNCSSARGKGHLSLQDGKRTQG
ncbi:MAG: response regulator [Cyanophyceae cyanobacterium]